MTFLVRFLVVLVVLYGLVCVLVFLFQARLVYFPGPPPGGMPAIAGASGRALGLSTEDGEQLSAWYFAPPQPHGVVLVSHGNAGSIADRVELARSYLALGWAVLLYDYRGYGGSSGTPSEEGTYRDAEAAYAYLVRVEGFAPEHVVLHGESLGVAVALELALRRPVAAVIAESGFGSLVEIGSEVYPYLPVRWLARIRYDNRAKVARLEVPLMVVHSPDDEVVPVQHALRLHADARAPKHLLLTAGGHNGGGFLNRREWRAEVGAFLRAFGGS